LEGWKTVCMAAELRLAGRPVRTIHRELHWDALPRMPYQAGRFFVMH
jgi:hypothetical protein